MSLRNAPFSLLPILGIAVAATLSSLSGCGSTEYIGKSYPETTRVDIYFHDDDIPEPHELLGVVSAGGNTYEQMERRLVEDAMAEGADAIVIRGADVGSASPASGNGEPHYVATGDGGPERVGSHPRWSTSEYTTAREDRRLSATLLKYLEPANPAGE